MKGIILAAGRGTRLYPMTRPVCKPLLPVYDKPLIYYPLSVLMQAGIREVLVIVPPGEVDTFAALLGDGSQLGMNIQYTVQPVARGIADALLIGREFVNGDDVCLVLGDNIFWSPNFQQLLKQAVANNQGATVFGCYVDDPRPFGVVEFDQDGKAISIEEKPQNPKSNYIVPGLYVYDGQAMDIAANLTPSARGELEITDVNLEYLHRNQLQVVPMEENYVWLDAGNANSMLQAAQTIHDLQANQQQYVGVIEQLAYQEGWISHDQLHQLGEELSMTEYGQHLLSL
ncbi:glucose-1-phosphate thymidylyltransferase RfbA [Pseudoflavonifractor sp. An85]|uniref:glucose-1-phosphate thymidylyltransferase RfbA n=1 Tax=Pseudoflavonifractor sp. An85 TaxID=1965661 RepID=UPI000B39EA53|nr:glucose-1-phosphate thymidylyltransferase RfbA [Pseudoflavonifractor sp. An85]OUN20071.1 glucose-1-phosphate thymidylyltransferase [Pseudoflavonifractor sp. An85]